MRGGLEHDPNDPVKNNTENHISLTFFTNGSISLEECEPFPPQQCWVHYSSQSSQDFHSASLPLTQYVEGESKPLLEACSD